jgi:phage FluMu gp28-like protein
MAASVTDFDQSDFSPKILLPLQREVVSLVDHYQLLVIEKARRIGVTWALALKAALMISRRKSAGGMNVYYIGYEKEMTREFITVVGDWMRALNKAAEPLDEIVLKDDNDRDIQAFRVRASSGFQALALTSSPRNLRGRQGWVLLDEFAFHDDAKLIMDAALPLTIRGGRVTILSTHNGEDSPFNELIQDVRAGKYGNTARVLRYTYRQAVDEGLIKQIFRVQGRTWSPEAEAAEIKQTYKIMSDPDQELDVIPSQGGGIFLPLGLINACVDDTIPVLRYKQNSEFTLFDEWRREADTRDWCESILKPILARMNPLLPTVKGRDFGRSVDLSVDWPLQIDQNMRLLTPFVVEFENIPFQQQKQIDFYINDRLPRFFAGAYDRTGNGAFLSERAVQQYGEGVVEGIHFTQEWYRENTPHFKATFEDRNIIIPKDRDIINDLRAFRMVRGVAQIQEKRTRGQSGSQRHGDAGIACLLADYSSRKNIAEYDYQAARRETVNPEDARFRDRADDDEDRGAISSGWKKGAW